METCIKSKIRCHTLYPADLLTQVYGFVQVRAQIGYHRDRINDIATDSSVCLLNTCLSSDNHITGMARKVSGVLSAQGPKAAIYM